MATYIDYDHKGQIDSRGNITILTDQEALSNAIKLWICSFRGERLYKPTRGGYVVAALLKPMSEDRVIEIESAIKTGLREDFQPSIKVTVCDVKPDYDNFCYYLHVEGYCPKFKAAIYTDTVLNALAK